MRLEPTRGMRYTGFDTASSRRRDRMQRYALALAGLVFSTLACASRAGDPPAGASPTSPPRPSPTTASALPTVATPPELAVGPTACLHPFFPMKAGTMWVFEGSYGRLTWTIESVGGDQEQGSATMVVNLEDEIVNVATWACDAEGLRVQRALLGGTKDVLTTVLEGVEIPAADLLKPGYQWNFIYEKDEGGGTIVTSETRSVAGTESRTIAGETVKALIVAIEQTVKLKDTGEVLYTASSTEVWGEGVGVVQTRAVLSNGNVYNTDLIEFRRP